MIKQRNDNLIMKGETMKKLIFCAIALAALLCILHLASARERGLAYHEVSIVDETGAPVTDISSINIYLPDTTTNATIYMDSGLQNAITQPITTTSTNTTFTQSTGRLYWWGPDGYDYTFTNGTNIARNAGHRTRTSSEARLYFPSYLADISSATYEDDETIVMGDDSDFTFNAGTTADRLTITPTTNGTSSIYMGSTAACCDVEFWGDTAGRDMMWDATDNRLEFEDNAILAIGTGNDWYIAHDGTTTTITGAATHASATIFSTDVTLTGNAYNVEWDNSSDTLHLLDNAELGIGGATTADGDVVFKHDGTTLTMTSIRADEPWKIGGTTYGFDITYYFEGAGTIDIDFDGDNMAFSDDMTLNFGTNDDVTLMYDETTDDNFEIAAGSVGMSITTNDFLATLDGAAADQFKVDATGTVAGDAINFETTDGGIMLNADGSSNGDIELNAADDLILTAAGDITITNTGNITVSGPFVLDTVVVPDGAAYTVLANNAGQVHLIIGQTADVTLTMPAEADDLYYKFVYVGGAEDAQDWIFDTGSDTNYFIGGLMTIDDDDHSTLVVYSDGNSNSKVSVLTPNAGTVVEMWCDGTNWYLSGTVVSGTDTAVTFADQ